MITYFLKKKIEKEAEEHGKKLMVYAGVALAGVGAYCVYKAIKNSKMSFEEEELRYLTNEDFDEDEYAKLFDVAIEEVDKKETEKKDLEKKVDEFNSRRISCENCTDATQEEMQEFLDKVKDSKKDVEVNKEDYKEEAYENYEYYDGHIIEKK